MTALIGKCYDVFDTFICKTDFCTCLQATQKDTVNHGVSVLRRNDKEIPIEYASFPLKNFEGKIIGCVEHIIDITDRLAKERTIKDQHESVLKLLREKSAKNVELARANAELLQLSQDLEALAQERTIAEMAMHIADKIKNPTTVIGGLIKAMAKELPENTVKNGKLQAILSEVQKLEERVDSFEKLSQEQKRLFIREDLRPILAEVIHTWSSKLTKKDIQLNIKKPVKPVTAIVNRRTLKVALLHILRNAIEASPMGSEVKIEINNYDGHPVIRISDQGTGIPSEIKNKLFEETVTTKPSGSGMGLILVKQILSEHQGDIEIESGPDKGTIVGFRFPNHWEEKKF